MNRTGKRSRRQTKIITGAVIVAIAAAAGAGSFIWLKNSHTQPVVLDSDNTVSTENAVLYNGKKYVYNDHLSNFLFLGIDAETQQDTKVGKADAGQADAVFLLSRDRVSHSIMLLSIPRDTVTEIEVFGQDGESLGKSKDHLSLAYAYGDGKSKSCELMETAVSNLLYGIPVQGYCSINMDGIPVLTEVIGGLTVEVPDEGLETINPQWTKGAQIELNGENVEDFVRYRDTQESQSALARLKRQQIFLQAYGARAREIYNEKPSFITELYDELKNYMVTNIGKDQFSKIMQDLSEGNEVKSWTLPGEGVLNEGFDEYRTDDKELYSMIIQYFYKEAE